MAKQSTGYLGGFSGRLGPAVGYMWNGKWCVRAHQPMVRNPRTEAQVAHRSLFKQEVQLAARMRWAVTTTLTAAAREAGMTSYNLFVSLNQPCFSLMDSRLEVDWASLQLSMGPVAPVRLGQPVLDASGRLEVTFERNPLHLASNAFDQVRLYVYSPTLGQGYLAAPVYRKEQRIAVVLPATFVGTELHLYAFVADRQGRYSPTTHATLAPGTSMPAMDDGIYFADNQTGESDPQSIGGADGAERIRTAGTEMAAAETPPPRGHGQDPLADNKNGAAAFM